MEIGSHFYAAVSDGVGDILKIVDGKLLRYHVDDLVAGRNISFILVIYQVIDFMLRYFFFIGLANNIAAGL